MLSLLLAATLAVAQVPDSAHVVLVATADVHGHATAWDYLVHRPSTGGLARVATVVDSLRRRYPGQVVMLDAGDVLQGSPFAAYTVRHEPAGPHPIVEAMNLVGYDAATPGERDLDRGLPAFLRAIGDAAFPYVSTNLRSGRSDRLLFRPYQVLRRQGVRVGIAGFTSPGIVGHVEAAPDTAARITPIGEAAGPALASLRREADLVVAVIHGSMAEASALVPPADHPDLVVVGHSAREVGDTMVGGVRFVHPGPAGGLVAVVHVSLAREGGAWRITGMRSDLLNTAKVQPSPLLEQRLAATHEAVRGWVDAPIGLAAAPMPALAARAQPTPILDFVLETMRRRSGAVLAAGPAFDLHAGLTADTIRRSDVLRLHPRDDLLRAVRISGPQLRAYLEWSARYFRTDPAGRIALDGPVPGAAFDVIRGAGYEIDLRRPAGDRIRDLRVGGRPVQPADSFTLAVGSDRASGADGYAMLAGAPVVYDRGERITDVLEAEIAGRGTVDPAAIRPSEWRIVPETAATSVRRLFGLAPPPLARSAADTVLFRLLATADLGEELPAAAGGLERAMDSLGAECACGTLRLDAGGSLRGSVAGDATGARAAIDVLEAMGYAAAMPGERDFDWPLDTLRRRLTESRFPWVASNLFDSATGRRPDWVVPERLIDTAGLRVTVIGYLSPEAKATQAAERTRGLRFGAGELGLHDVLGRLRATPPGVVVLLADAGATCDSLACQGAVVRLAEQLRGSGVDVIIAGGGSRPFETRVAGIPIVGPGGAGGLAVADVVKTPAGGREVRVRVERFAAGPPRPGTPLASVLGKLARRTDSLERRVLARLKRPLDRDGTQNAIGALVAEARRNVVRADLGLVRSGSLRGELPAGPVTRADLRQVEPADAGLVRLLLTGSAVTDLLERAVAGPDGPSAHLAGALVRYDPRAAPGRRVRKTTLAGGRQLRPRESYTLVTDEATAAGVGGLLPPGLIGERTGHTGIDALAAYLGRLPQPVELDAVAALQPTRP